MKIKMNYASDFIGYVIYAFYITVYINKLYTLNDFMMTLQNVFYSYSIDTIDEFMYSSMPYVDPESLIKTYEDLFEHVENLYKKDDA